MAPHTERIGAVGDKVTVRRAATGDLDTLADLFDDYRAFYDCPRDRSAARAFLSDRVIRGESIILVAHLDRVVGFAQLYPAFSSISMARTMVLNDLFVLPNVRRHGIAGLLIDAAVAHARDVGAVRVELATQRTNDNAQRLYLARRFIPDDQFVHMSLDLGGIT